MLEEHLNCLFYDLFGQDFQFWRPIISGHRENSLRTPMN